MCVYVYTRVLKYICICLRLYELIWQRLFSKALASFSYEYFTQTLRSLLGDSKVRLVILDGGQNYHPRFWQYSSAWLDCWPRQALNRKSGAVEWERCQSRKNNIDSGALISLSPMYGTSVLIDLQGEEKHF